MKKVVFIVFMTVICSAASFAQTSMVEFIFNRINNEATIENLEWRDCAFVADGIMFYYDEWGSDYYSGNLAYTETCYKKEYFSDFVTLDEANKLVEFLNNSKNSNSNITYKVSKKIVDRCTYEVYVTVTFKKESTNDTVVKYQIQNAVGQVIGEYQWQYDGTMNDLGNRYYDVTAGIYYVVEYNASGEYHTYKIKHNGEKPIDDFSVGRRKMNNIIQKGIAGN